MKDFREQNFYELLDLLPGASQQEVEAAYERARRIFSPDSVATYALFQTEELALLRSRIEEAFRTLGNLERRRKYDEELTRLEGPAWSPGTEVSLEQEPQPAHQPESAPPSPVAGLPLFERSASPPVKSAEQAEENDAPGQGEDSVEGEERAGQERREGLEDPRVGDSRRGDGAWVQGANEPSTHTVQDQVPASALPVPLLEEPSPGPLPVPAPSLEEPSPGVPPPTTAAPPGSQPPAPACPPGMPPIDERTIYDGHLLRQVREARGLTLEQVQQSTKINIFYLRLLEANDLGELPAPVYVRGYLRQLGRLLKLDAERLVAGFEALRGAPQ